MELNRNHYFLVGMILFLMGVQFRCLDSVQLNEPSTRFINAKLQGNRPTTTQTFASFMTATVGPPRRTIRVPRWLGWSLISVGGVLVLHSLAMRKPGG